MRVSIEEERRERLHVLSPVAEGRGGSPKERRMEKVVVLDVAEDGKVTRLVEEEEEDGDQPVPRLTLP